MLRFFWLIERKLLNKLIHNKQKENVYLIALCSKRKISRKISDQLCKWSAKWYLWTITETVCGDSVPVLFKFFKTF